MECHARRRSTVCAAQGDDGMPGLTLFDRVCCLKAEMSCKARCSLTVCAAQGRSCHATPDVVRLCVLLKGDDGKPHLTSFDSVCCLKAEMLCGVLCSLTVRAAQGR